jgi:hypothetical protein
MGRIEKSGLPWPQNPYRRQLIPLCLEQPPCLDKYDVPHGSALWYRRTIGRGQQPRTELRSVLGSQIGSGTLPSLSLP